MRGSDTKNELSQLYQIRFSDRALVRKNEIWKVLCRDFFSRFLSPTDTVVDIGCGYGEFINNISAGRRVAVDLNSDTKLFLNPGVEFFQGEALTLDQANLPSADVVFTSNFLEHLPDKPTLDKFLTQVHGVLKPGGKYIIMGPNLRYLPGEYWDFYDHHLGLTHLSLSEALRLRGYNIDVCIDRFLPYTTQTKLPTHPALVRIYLKAPMAWRFMGKQFLIVATRR